MSGGGNNNGGRLINLYRYYERIRRTADPTTLIPLMSDDAGYVGRNLYYLASENINNVNNNVNNNENVVDDEDIVFCHLPIMFQWTSFVQEEQQRQQAGNKDKTKNEIHTDVSVEAYGGSAAALLAVHHFNTGNGTIVDDLDGITQHCPIRFTTELLNSQGSGIRATRQLNRLLARASQISWNDSGGSGNGGNNRLTNPQPCAFMGSSLNSVTRKLGTVTGVYDLPHISSSSSSIALDEVAEYPSFARTNPSVSSRARFSIDYLSTQLNIDFVGILYVDNTYGNDYHLALLDYASQYNMTVFSESFRPEASDEELLPRLSQLADTGYHYFLGIFPQSDYQRIMTIAYELRIAGPDYFWMFNDALAPSFVNGATVLEENSPAAKATFGSAILTDEGGLPGLNVNYDHFVDVWKNVDEDFLDYFHSKHPPFPGDDDDDDDNSTGSINFERTKSFFTYLPPSRIAAFSYDAIISLGLSACKAWDELGLDDPSELVTTVVNGTTATTTTASNVEFFSGADHHGQLIDTTFDGASGSVSFGPQNDNDSSSSSSSSSSSMFSRTSESAYHVVSNILSVPRSADDSEASQQSQTTTGSTSTNDGTSNDAFFQGIPVSVFDPTLQKWIAYDVNNTDNGSQDPTLPSDTFFVYSDGSNTSPIQIPPAQQDGHRFVSTFVRVICLTLGSFALLMSIGFFVYCCIIHRQHRVIRAAQPIFLATICAGTFIMALSIIPASIDDRDDIDFVVDTADAATWISSSSSRGDAACILRFWFFAIGFCLVFSALFSKLWRINMLVARAITFQRVQIRYVDVLVPFGVLLSANVIILTLWTALDPPRFWREIIEIDEYNRAIQSTGYCTSDHLAAFIAPLLVVNGCAMILALWQAYVGRNITTDFSESKYIAMAAVCIFQSFFMGVPVLFIVERQPSAYLFVYTGITVIICYSMLLLLFVPKIHSIWYKGDQSIRLAVTPQRPAKTTTATPTTTREGPNKTSTSRGSTTTFQH